MRAITPVKPTTADMATLIDELFGRVSRALKEGESGSEVFPLKLRLLTTDFDRVDTGESYTKLHNFLECALGRPWAISVELFAF